jgi:hypothetical protein
MTLANNLAYYNGATIKSMGHRRYRKFISKDRLDYYGLNSAILLMENIDHFT